MKMRHLIIEGYCDGKMEKDLYPCESSLNMGIYCLECPRFSYSKCPNEIAISNDDGVVEHREDFIAFGGDMEPDVFEKKEEYLSIWKEICREKVNEAYENYMSKYCTIEK